VLEAGGNPRNATAAIRQLQTQMSAHDLPHLCFREFNVKTTALPAGSSKMAWLQQQHAALQATVTSATASSSSSGNLATSPSPGRVKLEPGTGGNTPMSQAYVYSVASVATSLPSMDQRFLDPVLGQPESSTDHRLRYHFWGGLVEPMLIHYPHLLRDRGNFSTVIEAIAAMSGACTEDLCVSTLVRLCQLAKSASSPFSVFAQDFADIRSIFAHLPDADLRPSDTMLRLLLLEAVSKDARYDVTLQFLRREALSLDATLQRLLAAASKIDAGPVPLKANAAVKDTPPCFSWRDKGHCRRGDRCNYSHAGPPGSAEASGTGGRRKRDGSKGKCLECGSVSHGVSECAIFKKRHAAMADTKKALLANALSPPPAPAATSPTSLPAPPALQGNAAHVGFDPIIMAAITANERDPDTSGSESP